MLKEGIGQRGLVLIGCGKMGTALLGGWVRQGMDPSAIWITEPTPSAEVTDLAARGAHLNAALPPDPAVVVIAVKPQMMTEVLPRLAPLGGGGTLFLSIAAGTPIATFQSHLGAATPVVRAMPNTPAAIGAGISGLVGNGAASADDMDLAEALMAAVGETVRIADESLMDAVTAVSGSGPAYVFYLIETLAAAGQAEGLPADLALRLARATVAGAGQLAQSSGADPAQLRQNVTSPGGTTAAALAVLMRGEDGLGVLMTKAVRAAAARGRELAQ